jgi:hypothetical protein
MNKTETTVIGLEGDHFFFGPSSSSTLNIHNLLSSLSADSMLFAFNILLHAKKRTDYLLLQPSDLNNP